ncbi:MAG: HSP20-like chaperone [Amphiamblys sp. WSBS2006]|nr:MAG: HSP20-like chaperone [Amphiamblys sp. WSBS2006]
MNGADQVTPRTYWAQDKESIWLTVDVADVKEETVTFEERRVLFKGTRGGDGAICVVELELQGAIEPSTSTTKVTARNVLIVLKKKEPGFWSFLLSTKERRTFLYTDFSRWKDEEDEEEDGGLFDYSKYEGLGEENNSDDDFPEEGTEEDAGEDE